MDETTTIQEKSGVPLLKHDPQPVKVTEEYAANG